MISRRRRRSAYTLIELMITLAVVGLLAAIAIPNYISVQRRARTAEAASNLAALQSAEDAYFAETGAYVAAIPSPSSTAGAQARDFVDVGGGFTTLGWNPTGKVYFNYAVTVAGLAYTAEASADLDTNGVPQVWGYVHADPAGNTVVGTFSCTGAWDPLMDSATALDVVGPCGASFGRSEF
jgi:type IV pilus assembly protein PilA